MLDHMLDGYVKAMKCEHRHIEQLLRRLGATLDQASTEGRTPTSLDTLAAELEELDRCLTRHFKKEEDGGFLEDAANAAPRFAGEAQGLLDEHVQMLTDVRNLASMARRHAEAGQADWPPFAAELRKVIRQLMSHELREHPAPKSLQCVERHVTSGACEGWPARACTPGRALGARGPCLRSSIISCGDSA